MSLQWDSLGGRTSLGRAPLLELLPDLSMETRLSLPLLNHMATVLTPQHLHFLLHGNGDINLEHLCACACVKCIDLCECMCVCV